MRQRQLHGRARSSRMHSWRRPRAHAPFLHLYREPDARPPRSGPMGTLRSFVADMGLLAFVQGIQIEDDRNDCEAVAIE